MKKYIIILGIIASILCTQPILAQESSNATAGAKRSEKIAEQKTTAIVRLKEKANKEIDKRVTALTKGIEKINAAKRLTADQKNALVTQAQAEVTSLQMLKTKIAGDTDIATLRTDVQSIVSSYRIFALFIPKMTIIAHGDRILSIVDGEMTTLKTKLKARIDEAAGKGKNVDTLTVLMTQYQTKLDDAKTQANSAITKVTPLTPSGWPGNKTELQAARDLLKVAQKDLTDAIKIANDIRTQLKAMNPIGTPKTTKAPETEE